MNDLDDVRQEAELLRLERPGTSVNQQFIARRLLSGEPTIPLTFVENRPAALVYDSRIDRQAELLEWASGVPEASGLARLARCVRYIQVNFHTIEARSRAFDVLADLTLSARRPSARDTRVKRPKLTDLFNRAAERAGTHGLTEQDLYDVLVSSGHVCKRPTVTVRMWVKRAVEAGHLRPHATESGRYVWQTRAKPQ